MHLKIITPPRTPKPRQLHYIHHLHKLMMESVSFQGLRQRHIHTTSDSTSKELTSEMPTIEKSPLHHDLNDEFMSDEITSTPFQTRAGSPSRGEIMPHTVAQATKFMSDLHAIVETDTKSNTADVGSNASIASEFNEKSPEFDDGVPVPAAFVSVPYPHLFGLSNTTIFLMWVCFVLLTSPLFFYKPHGEVHTIPNDHLTSCRVIADFDLWFTVSMGVAGRRVCGSWDFCRGHDHACEQRGDSNGRIRA